MPNLELKKITEPAIGKSMGNILVGEDDLYGETLCGEGQWGNENARSTWLECDDCGVET